MSDPQCIIGIYRKGGGMSFLEEMNINQMVIDAAITDIQEQLFEQWAYENLNEGEFYADFRFAEMSDDNFLKQKFNEFYELSPENDYYLECEEK